MNPFIHTFHNTGGAHPSRCAPLFLCAKGAEIIFRHRGQEEGEAGRNLSPPFQGEGLGVGSVYKDVNTKIQRHRGFISRLTISVPLCLCVEINGWPRNLHESEHKSFL